MREVIGGSQSIRESLLDSLMVELSSIDETFFFFYFYFYNFNSYQIVLCTVPTSYEETLKPTSSIIPTSVLERDVDKYNQNNNNNNSISNLSIGNSTSTNTALKIEEVSNETSNLMIEDRQNTTTTSTVAASTR